MRHLPRARAAAAAPVAADPSKVARAAALTAVAALIAAALTACASAPATSGPPLQARVTPSSASAIPSPPAASPPAGSRAEAAALARLMLSRLRLPSGARRLPPDPLPPSLNQPAVQYVGSSTSLDQHQLFALPQPADTAAALLAARVPPGMSRAGAGEGSGPGGVTMREVTEMPRSLPAGLSHAELVLTVIPAASGDGSLLRADAQVSWYPPRSAAEYIDPARYHVLSITVTIYGRQPHTVHKVETSRAFIARVAEALDRMPADPFGVLACPADFEDYRLAFSVSTHSRPAVIVSANQSGCGGAQVTVDGQSQPTLADKGTVAALVRQVVTVTPQI